MRVPHLCVLLGAGQGRVIVENAVMDIEIISRHLHRVRQLLLLDRFVAYLHRFEAGDIVERLHVDVSGRYASLIALPGGAYVRVLLNLVESLGLLCKIKLIIIYEVVCLGWELFLDLLNCFAGVNVLIGRQLVVFVAQFSFGLTLVRHYRLRLVDYQVLARWLVLLLIVLDRRGGVFRLLIHRLRILLLFII